MDNLDLPLDLAASEGTPNRDSEKDDTSQEDASPQEIEDGKLPAVLGYVPFLFFVPLFGVKNNSFAVRHGRQAFALFLVEIVALLFLIDVVSEFFWTIVFVACIGIALVSCANAAQGRFWKIPYLGDLVKKHDLFGGK